MAFDLRAGSTDILTPVRVFPGDDDTDPQVYRHAIFSGYLSSIATISGAARGYGVAVDADTFERWKRIGAAAGLLDAFLDDAPDPQHAISLYHDGLSVAFDDGADLHAPPWADRRLEPAVRLLRNSVRVLPADSVTMLLASSRFIGDAPVRKASCTAVPEYVRVLRLEAFHSSRLIHGSVSAGVRAQAGFADFALWCTNAIELGTLADSTWDLWADRRSGRTGVEATLLNSARIAWHAIAVARAMSRPRRNRRATLRALYARCRFSPLPTGVAMRRHAVPPPGPR